MTSVDELLEKAERFADQLRWQEAAQVARQAVDLEPDNRRAKDKLGWYLSRSKDYAAAIKVYEALTEEAPDNYRYPYMLGYQYYDQQDYSNAIPWFEKALLLKPDYLVVLYRCGYAYTQSGNVGAAEERLRECVRLWRNLTEEEAKQRESQTYADACFQLGKIHSERNDWQCAILAFAESVTYDGNDADKLYNLGKVLIKNEQFTQALEVLQKADHITPRKHYIQTYLAIAHHHLDNLTEAERIFDAIPPRMKDQFPYIWQHHAELYMTQGRAIDVVKILSTATRKPSEKGLHSWYDVFLLLGRACEQNGDLAGAYQAYQGANFWHEKSRKKTSPLALQRIQYLQTEAAERDIDLVARLPVENKPVEQPADGSAVIKKFLTDRGFGFIKQENGEDLFVHIRNVINPENIREGAHVEYEVGEGRKGPEAIRVRVLD